MMNNFTPSLNCVLQSEGGWVNDPQDPGGATDEGVTQHQYDLWRIAHGLQTQSVKFIQAAEVEGFYRAWYWDKIHGDALPAGVDYCVFDCAVNSGPHRAAEWLQHAVGASPDGQIGSKTLSAVNSMDAHTIVDLISNERLAFLEGLPTWPHFGHGWKNRIDKIETVAKGMVQ